MSSRTLVLVVDDNVINRQYFSMSLKKSGFDVIAVESAVDAINQCNQVKFSVILMDIRMPEIDGYECTRQIRQIPFQKETPIYATSAEELFKEEEYLFNGFLLKPISSKQLKKIILKHCLQNEKTAFNRDTALKFAYNDLDIVKTMVKLFINEFPLQIINLTELIKVKNTIAIDELIHKMKGSCKACGAQEIELILKKFSTLEKGCTINQLLLNIDKLKKAFKNFSTVTQSL